MSERNIVKQSYLLNNSKYKLSAISMDIIMGLISELKNEDSEFSIIRIKISELEKKINKRIDKRYLRRLSFELLSPDIEINLEHGGFLRSAWFSSFEYNPQSNFLELSFDPKLKPYLLELKNNFALGYLSEITLLNSEYSKRIYMLLRQRSNIGKYEISLKDLQEILKVPKSYLVYKVFKKRILVPTIENINSRTTMNITLNEIKNLRKVESLKFEIKAEKIKKNKLKDFELEFLEGDK